MTINIITNPMRFARAAVDLATVQGPQGGEEGTDAAVPALFPGADGGEATCSNSFQIS